MTSAFDWNAMSAGPPLTPAPPPNLQTNNKASTADVPPVPVFSSAPQTSSTAPQTSSTAPSSNQRNPSSLSSRYAATPYSSTAAPASTPTTSTFPSMSMPPSNFPPSFATPAKRTNTMNMPPPTMPNGPSGPFSSTGNTVPFPPTTTPLSSAAAPNLVDTSTTDEPTLLRQPTLESGKPTFGINQDDNSSKKSRETDEGGSDARRRLLRAPTLESGAGPMVAGPPSVSTLPFVAEEENNESVQQITTGANDGKELKRGLSVLFNGPPESINDPSFVQPNNGSDNNGGPPLFSYNSAVPPPMDTLSSGLQKSKSQESLKSSNGSFHDTGVTGGIQYTNRIRSTSPISTASSDGGGTERNSGNTFTMLPPPQQFDLQSSQQQQQQQHPTSLQSKPFQNHPSQQQHHLQQLPPPSSTTTAFPTPSNAPAPAPAPAPKEPLITEEELRALRNENVSLIEQVEYLSKAAEVYSEQLQSKMDEALELERKEAEEERANLMSSMQASQQLAVDHAVKNLGALHQDAVDNLESRHRLEVETLQETNKESLTAARNQTNKYYQHAQQMQQQMQQMQQQMQQQGDGGSNTTNVDSVSLQNQISELQREIKDKDETIEAQQKIIQELYEEEKEMVDDDEDSDDLNEDTLKEGSGKSGSDGSRYVNQRLMTELRSILGDETDNDDSMLWTDITLDDIDMEGLGPLMLGNDGDINNFTQQQDPVQPIQQIQPIQPIQHNEGTGLEKLRAAVALEQEQQRQQDEEEQWQQQQQLQREQQEQQQYQEEEEQLHMKIPTRWQEISGQDDVYYYNSETQESSWDPPNEEYSKWDNDLNKWVTVVPQQLEQQQQQPLPQQFEDQHQLQQQQQPQPNADHYGDLHGGSQSGASQSGSRASSPRGSSSQRNSRNFGMDDVAPLPQQQQQYVPTTAVEEDLSQPLPPPPSTSTTIVEAWNNVFEALQSSGKRIQARQLNDYKKGIVVLRKVYDNNELIDDYKEWLNDVRSSIDNGDYASASTHIKKLVTDKKCWKKHSQWIKSLKGCIQLASRHLEGKKISKIKQVAADPYAAAAKGMSKTGRPTIMQPRQQMQPQQMHQVSQGAGNGGQAAVQMLNNAIVNNIPLAKQLLQNGTNPVPVGPEQNTALHIACTSGSYESVALLLQYHCSPDVQNAQGETALHLCGNGGHFECAKALIDAGANKYIKNNSQETPSESMQSKMLTVANPNQNFMKTLELLQ